MNTQLLMDTTRAMVADDKGVLAMDESHSTCNRRFAKLGRITRDCWLPDIAGPYRLNG